MKRCKLFYLIVGVIICAMLCNCNADPKKTPKTDKDEDSASTDTVDGTDSPTTEATDDGEPVYLQLMNDIHDLILSEDYETDSELAAQALSGILDAGYSETPEDTLNHVGYSLRDLNADGMPELVIGGINEKNFGRDIYAIYTCVQDKIYCVCSGWSRSYVGWMGENEFYYLGSGGASSTIIGQYELLPNATEWSCVDLYFTDEDVIYHNQTGICDTEYAEVSNMTMEEFWELNDELNDKVLEFELTPFSTSAY